MSAARELTTADVTAFRAGNLTANRCGHRISGALRSAVIGKRSVDAYRARSPLQWLGRGGI